MLFLAIFAVGLFVCGSIAYAGLVRGEVALSKNKPITGTVARNIGIGCAILALAMIAGIAWLFMGAKGI